MKTLTNHGAEIALTTTENEAVAQQQACSDEHASRMRFLATLDTLTGNQRWHLLQIEDDEEIASLYIVAVNDYGSEAPVTETLCTMLGLRIERKESQNVPDQATAKGKL